MELFQGRFLIEGIFEWSQVLPGYNWRTFHPVMVEVEDDRIMLAVEATVILLGIGIRLRWTYGRSATLEEIKEQIANIEDILRRDDERTLTSREREEQ